MTKYICICGSGHSGSTLLDLLLGAHPGIVSLGEIINLVHCIVEDRQCTCRKPLRECDFWSAVRLRIAHDQGIDIFEHPDDFPVSIIKSGRSPRDQLIHYQRLILAWQGHRALTRAEIVPRNVLPAHKIITNMFHIYDAVRAVSGCQAVVDASKSPIHMKWLWMNRPSEVKALYLVRDGRAVIASNMRKGSSSGTAVRGWVKTAVLARMMFQTMPRDAWLLVRYEDLCRQPEQELRRICQFLSLEFVVEMLDFRGRIHHDVDGNRMRFGDSSEIVNRESWRQQLNPTDLRLFERFAGPINRRLGYSD